MGNCVFTGLEEVDGLMIKVVTFNGGVMELHPPVLAECITNGFPGHAIFHSQDLFSKPLMHNEELTPGEEYFLRPLTINPHGGLPSMVAPYRVSSDHHGLWNNGGYEDGASAWRVKLVISPAKLSEILAQDSRTEALIESMRTVAKCGNGTVTSATSSAASSDQWSLASSRKGS